MSEKKGKSSKAKSELIEAERVPYIIWFTNQVKAGKLGFWQEKEVSVFFKEKGLSDNEEPDKYSELLKLY